MRLTLSPIRGLPGQVETTLSISGDVLWVDGTSVDFGSLVPDGGEFHPDEGDHPFIGVISRIDGEIQATVRVVLGDDTAPDQPIDPAHWLITATDGPVSVPAIRTSKEDPLA